MARHEGNEQEKLGRKIGGGLIGYTLAVSLAVHALIIGLAFMPKELGGGATGEMKMGGKLNVKIIKKTYDELPPPPSIEQPAEPTAAPKGLEAKGAVGEVPLPVPDAEAEAKTISDATAGTSAGVGDGTQLIVDTSANTTVEESHPWDAVNFDVEYSEPPVCIDQVKPKYPDIARDSKVEGDVVLFVYIDEKGNVRNAIVQSSPGLPALDEEARKAAMRCKFKPAKQQGQPVGVWYNIVMQFRLH